MASRNSQEAERPGVPVGMAERHAGRTADKNAAFFTPHLKQGMRVLDVGCGPGTITLGFAERVAPGEAVGIDLDAGQVESAVEWGHASRLLNVRFESGDIYSLPFDDASFDATFAHTVFMHLKDRQGALREVHRILKPGGFLGVSERMWPGAIYSGHEKDLERSDELYTAWAASRGVDLNIGMHLRGMLLQAGFRPVEASASFGEVYGTPEATRCYADIMVKALQESSWVEFVTRNRLATVGEMKRLEAAWNAWGDAPDAFHAQANGEALGWKPVPERR